MEFFYRYAYKLKLNLFPYVYNMLTFSIDRMNVPSPMVFGNTRIYLSSIGIDSLQEISFVGKFHP